LSSVKNYFLIYNEKVLIRYEALFYFGMNMNVLREITHVTKENVWESLYLTRDGAQQRFIILETIPANVRDEFKLPKPEDILASEESYSINIDDLKKNKIAELKLFIEHEYKTYTYGEDKISGTHFMRYPEQRMMIVVNFLQGGTNTIQRYESIARVLESNKLFFYIGLTIFLTFDL